MEGLADFYEQREGRSDACYVFAEVRRQIMKIPLNGRVLEVA